MKIVNIVAIVKLSEPLDLVSLQEKIKGYEISFSGNRWLKMRLPPKNLYVAFYKSGKILLTGIKSLEEVETVSEQILRILIDAEFHLHKEKIIIHNVVLMDSAKMNASLEKILYSLDSTKASYEPEQFPGLIYKDFEASFLLFQSGKFIITGLKEPKTGEVVASKFIRLIEDIQ